MEYKIELDSETISQAELVEKNAGNSKHIGEGFF